MATCTAINLALKDSEIFKQPYVLKLFFSEGLSLPALAKITLISSEFVATSDLQQSIGVAARVEIVQDNEASRFIQGKIVSASFVQKTSKRIDSDKGVTYSYVYELYLASALCDLQKQHLESYQGSTNELLKEFLQHFKDSTHEYELGKLIPSFDIGDTNAHTSAYTLLSQTLYFSGLNYALIHQATDFKELLYINGGFDLHSNYPWLYQFNTQPSANQSSINQLSANQQSDLKGVQKDQGEGEQGNTQVSHYQEFEVSTSYALDQESSSIFDLSYTFNHKPSTIKVSEEITAQEEQELALDPLVKLLQPSYFKLTTKGEAKKIFYTQARLTKLRQSEFEASNISALANHLAFQPGFSFTLKGLGSDLSLMVIRSIGVAVAPFPTDRAYPAPTHTEKTLKLGLTLIDKSNYSNKPGCFLSLYSVLSPAQVQDYGPMQRFATSQAHLALSSTPADTGIQLTNQSAMGETTIGNAASNFFTHDSFNNSVEALKKQIQELQVQQQLETPIVVEGVVCTKDGDTSKSKGMTYLAENDNVAEPRHFYVKLSTSNDLVLAESLIEFKDGGMFPRVGDNVRLLALKGKYLYLSQVTSTDLVFNDAERLSKLYSRQWKVTAPPKNITLNQKMLTTGEQNLPSPTHNTVNTNSSGSSNTSSSSTSDSSGSDSSNASNTTIASGAICDSESEIGMSYLDSQCDLVLYHYTHGSLNTLAFNQASVNNSASLLNDYQDKLDKLNKIYPAFQKAQANYEQAHKNYFDALAKNDSNTSTSEKARQNASDAFIEQYNKLYAALADIGSTLKLQNNGSMMLNQIYAKTGDIELNAPQGKIELLSDNTNLTSTTKTQITAKEITLNADQKISLAVGGNAITIDRNGIAIESRKWTEVSGLLDSIITLDSMSGVSISGMSTGMTGMLGVNISDGFGAYLGLSSGAANLGGIKCDLKAILNSDSLLNLCVFGETVMNELQNLMTTLMGIDSTFVKQLHNTVYFGCSDVSDLFLACKDLKDKAGKNNGNSSVPANFMSFVKSNIIKIVELIIKIINTIEHIMSLYVSDKLNDSVKESCPNFTVRDCIRTISAFMKFSLVFGIAISSVYAGYQSNSSAEVDLSPDTFSISSGKTELKQREILFANNPIAGTAAPTA